MSRPWRVEFWRLATVLFFVTAASLLFGHFSLFLSLGLVSLAGWHFYQLHCFERWLRSGKKSAMPDISGVWEELYFKIYRLRERNLKSKRRLTAYLSRFQESTAALPDAVVVLSEDRIIEWFNATAGVLLKLKAPADFGNRIDNLIRSPQFIRYLEAQNYSEPIEIVSPVDDQVRILVHVVPYGSNQRLMVLRDITRLYKLEQIRRDFVANVSHELATPLTVISGYLESLTTDVVPNQRWLEAVTQMRGQTTRMQSIVNDLLMLTQLEATEQDDGFVKVAVPGMLHEIINQARVLAAEKQQHIAVDVDPELELRGKEKALYSAFSNILSNAVRYTPDGGEISVRWYRRREGACFEVRDSGIGIPAHYVPRLTERFFRVDDSRSRETGGTGLGLAIVKHVLNLHQARLQVDTELGKGSTFYCYFPAQLIVEHVAA